MAKGSGWGSSFGSKFGGAKPKKQPEAPAPRRTDLEAVICRAVNAKVTLELRYKDDLQARTFHPYVLWQTESGNVVVYGFQARDPNDPLSRPDVRQFTVGKMRDVHATGDAFVVGQEFQPSNFTEGVICKVAKF